MSKRKMRLSALAMGLIERSVNERAVRLPHPVIRMACAVAACSLLFAASAMATDISSSNGNASTDNWNLTTTWTPAQVPVAGDRALIGNDVNSGNVIVNDTEAASEVWIAFQNSHSLNIQTGANLSISSGVLMSGNGVPSAVNHTGGNLLMGNGAVIYDGYNGPGTYTMSSGSISGNGRLYVGYLGDGVFNQSGGTNTANIFALGNLSGRTGVFNLSGGTLNPVQNFIGENFAGSAGTGTLNQSAGTYNPGNLTLGDVSGSTGTYNLNAGTFSMASAQNLIIGNAGNGTWNIGDASGTATINQTTAGGLGIYTVRASAAASGTIHGWGVVPFSGSNFINNGRIIADGFGTARTLDLSAPSKVTNLIENVIANGSTNNGYFAVNKGILALPAIKSITANTRNWGESDTGTAQADSQIDLVNSIQMTFGGTITNGGTGNLAISLLANDSFNIPGQTPVGLWQFVKNGGLNFDSLNLTFRYNDLLGGTNPALKLYYNSAGTWVEIPSTLDTTNFLISSTSPMLGTDFASGTNPTDFLVAFVPEPASAALLVLGIAPLLGRRNRRA